MRLERFCCQTLFLFLPRWFVRDLSPSATFEINVFICWLIFEVVFRHVADMFTGVCVIYVFTCMWLWRHNTAGVELGAAEATLVAQSIFIHFSAQQQGCECWTSAASVFACEKQINKTEQMKCWRDALQWIVYTGSERSYPECWRPNTRRGCTAICCDNWNPCVKPWACCSHFCLKYVIFSKTIIIGILFGLLNDSTVIAFQLLSMWLWCSMTANWVQRYFKNGSSCHLITLVFVQQAVVHRCRITLS